MANSRGRRKVRQGIVASTRMERTISVLVERKLPHPVYGKYHKLSKKFLAHDPEQTCREGDRVSIIECRPMSRWKKWRLLEVLERKV